MVTQERDSLGRRSRTTPQSTGKHITPQEADLLWFRKLYDHGSLPSSYLLQYSQHLRRSRKRASERLTDLFNEAETKHGGRYLERPPQQFRTIDSRYNQLVYDLTPAAATALRVADPDLPTRGAPSGPWLHQCMVSCVTASIELATLDRADISYIPQHQILERAKTELRYPVTFQMTNTAQAITKDLIPDALFGLQYHTAKGDRFRFFVVECDRSTEPATTTNWNRKSWLRSFLQYREYVGRGAYKTHLKLTAPLLALNVSTDAKRLDKMIAVTDKESGDAGNSYLLFQHIRNFGPIFKPSDPMMELLELPWRRAGQGVFNIDVL